MGDAQMGQAQKADDKTFMKKAAEGGLAEVQLGQLAQQNGQSQDVKDFGKRMVDDHTKANDQLKQIASQKGVTLPTSPNSHDQAEYNRLSKMQGDSFDKAYSKMMVSDHKKDVSEFKHEASSGTDNDVKGFASQTLPTLEEHLQMAEKMNGSAKSSSGMAKKSGTQQ
jgi:putative membrane protein